MWLSYNGMKALHDVFFRYSVSFQNGLNMRSTKWQTMCKLCILLRAPALRSPLGQQRCSICPGQYTQLLFQD